MHEAWAHALERHDKEGNRGDCGFLIEGMDGGAYLKFCIFVFLKVYLFAVRGS